MIVEIDSRNIHPERTLRNVIDAVFIIVAWKNFLCKKIVCSEKEPEKAVIYVSRTKENNKKYKGECPGVYFL